MYASKVQATGSAGISDKVYNNVIAQVTSKKKELTLFKNLIIWYDLLCTVKRMQKLKVLNHFEFTYFHSFIIINLKCSSEFSLQDISLDLHDDRMFDTTWHYKNVHLYLSWEMLKYKIKEIFSIILYFLLQAAKATTIKEALAKWVIKQVIFWYRVASISDKDGKMRILNCCYFWKMDRNERSIMAISEENVNTDIIKYLLSYIIRIVALHFARNFLHHWSIKQ